MSDTDTEKEGQFYSPSRNTKGCGWMDINVSKDKTLILNQKI